MKIDAGFPNSCGSSPPSSECRLTNLIETVRPTISATHSRANRGHRTTEPVSACTPRPDFHTLLAHGGCPMLTPGIGPSLNAPYCPFAPAPLRAVAATGFHFMIRPIGNSDAFFLFVRIPAGWHRLLLRRPVCRRHEKYFSKK